jgi:hypothetical protein
MNSKLRMKQQQQQKAARRMSTKKALMIPVWTILMVWSASFPPGSAEGEKAKPERRFLK